MRYKQDRFPICWRVAHPFAPHRNSVTPRIDFEGAAVFVFQKAAGYTCDIPADIPAAISPRSQNGTPRKIIHAHSLRLLEIAPKPCYKKLHPKYPNNIFVLRTNGARAELRESQRDSP
jgi:hypothetical protein